MATTTTKRIRQCGDHRDEKQARRPSLLLLTLVLMVSLLLLNSPSGVDAQVAGASSDFDDPPAATTNNNNKTPPTTTNDNACMEDNDCQNGGSCIFASNDPNNPGTFNYCHCATGFGGSTCQVACDLDCHNGASCRFFHPENGMASSNAMFCECVGMFQGEQCEIPYTTCDDYQGGGAAVCYFGGECLPDGSCACPEGRGGDLCETKYVEGCLTDWDCWNGGTCSNIQEQDGGGKNTCQCRDGFYGDNDCSQRCSKVCQNGGKCRVVDDDNGAEYCACADDSFSGEFCQIIATVVTCPDGVTKCQHGGECILSEGQQEVSNLYDCSCPRGWAGDSCERQQDDSSSAAATSEATTSSSEHHQIGDDPPSYDMSTTTTQLQQHCVLDNDCANGGICIHPSDDSDGARDDVPVNICQCTAGFGGHKCEDVCTLHCQNGASCRYFEEEDAPPQLLTSPDGGGGGKPDDSNMYCECLGLYQGELCEIPYSLCPDGVTECLFGGDCTMNREEESEESGQAPQVNDVYQCECPEGRGGDSCELDVSNNNLCGGSSSHECHSGTCVTLNETTSYCHCFPGFAGPDCRQKKCTCENGGHCKLFENGDDDEYYCDCSGGGMFQGERCEIPYTVCNDAAQTECLFGGTCLVAPNGQTATCKCPPGRGGDNCELEYQGPCQSDEDCQNGGHCILPEDSESLTSCWCPAGFGGELCAEVCPLTCHNGGSCRHYHDRESWMQNSSHQGEYCDCIGQFSGDQCEVPFELCGNDGDKQCLYGGRCVEHSVDSYTCNCPKGRGGESCEKKYVEHCTNDLDCLNDGTCEAFQVTEQEGTSKTTVTRHQCACADGYSGADCSLHCTLSCQHGSVCKFYENASTASIDESMMYCDCEPLNQEEAHEDHSRPVYSGNRCEIATVTCADGKTTCLHGGQCVLDVTNPAAADSLYKCSCPTGRAGESCDKMASKTYCASDADCHHGGTCVHPSTAQHDEAETNGLTWPSSYCHCAQGYGGHDCSHACSLDCQNGGSCRFYGQLQTTPKKSLNETVTEQHAYCACVGHFQGTDCSVPYEVCPDDVTECLFGGVCTAVHYEGTDAAALAGSETSYRCDCPDDRHGPNCELSGPVQQQHDLNDKEYPKTTQDNSHLTTGRIVGIFGLVVVVLSVGIPVGFYVVDKVTAMHTARKANRVLHNLEGDNPEIEFEPDDEENVVATTTSQHVSYSDKPPSSSPTTTSTPLFDNPIV